MADGADSTLGVFPGELYLDLLTYSSSWVMRPPVVTFDPSPTNKTLMMHRQDSYKRP